MWKSLNFCVLALSKRQNSPPLAFSALCRFGCSRRITRAVPSPRYCPRCPQGCAPRHRSHAQVKDGVLCRDATDLDHFYLIGEWADIEEHRRIRELVAREIKPEFVQLIEGGHFAPSYAEIVSMTPQEVLDKAR
jgi:hypothetical protein